MPNKIQEPLALFPELTLPLITQVDLLLKALSSHVVHEQLGVFPTEEQQEDQGSLIFHSIAS